MDITPLVNGLYGLPVLGLVFQAIGYLVAVIPPNSTSIMSQATPLALAALCGVLCERSGVVNIGIEGTMLASAFTAWVVGVAINPMFQAAPTDVFGITIPLVIALIAAIGVALLISALHAWLSISLRADQIISGTIINIGAVGITGYMYTLLAPQSPVGAGEFSAFVVPTQIADLPLVGWLLNAVLGQGPIGMVMIVLVIALQIMLFRSRWGLRTRAVGEHPRAAETVGIDVIRLRYRNVVMSGALAALGGAWLTMEHGSSFSPNMTAGRGFIGLAAMIVGRWTPLGALGAALLFASATGFSTSLQISPPTGDLGQLMGHVPGEFWEALPYIITIVILAGLIGRSIAPAADGQPYERESAS